MVDPRLNPARNEPGQVESAKPRRSCLLYAPVHSHQGENRSLPINWDWADTKARRSWHLSKLRGAKLTWVVKYRSKKKHGHSVSASLLALLHLEFVVLAHLARSSAELGSVSPSQGCTLWVCMPHSTVGCKMHRSVGCLFHSCCYVKVHNLVELCFSSFFSSSVAYFPLKRLRCSSSLWDLWCSCWYCCSWC